METDPYELDVLYKKNYKNDRMYLKPPTKVDYDITDITLDGPLIETFDIQCAVESFKEEALRRLPEFITSINRNVYMTLKFRNYMQVAYTHCYEVGSTDFLRAALRFYSLTAPPTWMIVMFGKIIDTLDHLIGLKVMEEDPIPEVEVMEEQLEAEAPVAIVEEVVYSDFAIACIKEGWTRYIQLHNMVVLTLLFVILRSIINIYRIRTKLEFTNISNKRSVDLLDPGGCSDFSHAIKRRRLVY